MENRYDKYKDSGIAWIGEIPEHWDITNIKNHYNVILGKMVERNNDSSTGGENYLCAANIKWNGVDTGINKKMYFSDIEKEKYLLLYNDVLIMEGGMAGTTCIYKNEFSPCYVQNSVNVCRAKKSFNNKFLYYWMYVPYYNGYIDTICNKATIKHYTKEKVQNTPILVPPLSEQQSIANYLEQKCGEIDEMITLQEEMITKLQSYKQSVITEAVTKGLDKNVPLKDSGIEWIGEIPEHWEVKRLKFSCNVFGRIGFRGYKSDDLVSEGNGAITLSPSNMKDMKMDYTNRTYLSWKKYYESPEIMISKNDILMVKTGSTYGKCSFVDDIPMECTINPQIVVFKQHKDYPKFLAYSFQTKATRAFVETSVVGGTIPTIAQEKIMNYFFAFPPLSEQQSIANYLDQKCSEIDELISIKQQKIEKLKDYKKSLIFECVTGKRKV